MSARFFVVDGPGFLYRAYHALPYLSNSKGQATHAVRGVSTMLLKLLREENPAYAAVAWDPPGPTFREEKLPSYKETRPGMPDDLRSQIILVKRVFEALRLPLLEVPGFEADDVLGTLVDRMRSEAVEMVLVTADKDMLQLVGPRVRVFHTGKETFLDESGVEAFFGVRPTQVADVLALMGDSVDNVPGVPGVGPVTAKKWIQQYGDLTSLLAHADEIPGKVGENLRQNREAALLSRRLVEIPVDLPIPFDSDALRCSEPDYPRLKDLFVRLEFHSLAAEIQGESAAAPEVHSRRLAAGEPFAAIEGRAGVALLNRGDRTLLAISDGATTQIAEENTGRMAELWAAIDREGASFAMADAKPLDALLARAGRWVRADVFDVCLAQYVLSSGVASPELEPMAFQRLGQKLLSDKEAGVISCALPESYEIASADRWLAERASASARLAETLRVELEKRPALDRVYREIERPLTPVLARMEIDGVAIDVPLLREISVRMDRELRELEQRIWAEAGEEFNINSPVKLGQILFERLGYPVLKKTAKTRSSSTGFEVLTELAERGLPLPKLVLEFREISKLKGTYVDALPELADREGRIHSSFRQTVAATGRLSSSDPNLQNIPIRTQTGREIRKAFVAPPGRQLVVADYSQIELRILAHLSGDEALMHAFAEGQDIHSATASKIFGVSPDLVSREMRFAAKRINFALLYGMAPFTLGKELGVSTSEAKSYVDSYFAQFPKVRACLDAIIAEARRTREVTTLFGRVRPIPEIAASNPNVRGNAERMALNAPFQGAAADIIKIAMIRLHTALSEAGLAARLVLQVHDELVLEAPSGEVPEVSRVVREVMEGAAQLKVRLAVDVGSGPDWLSAK